MSDFPFQAIAQNRANMNVFMAACRDELDRAHFFACQHSVEQNRTAALVALLSPILIRMLDRRLLSDFGMVAENFELLLGPQSRDHIAAGGSTKRPEAIHAEDLAEALENLLYVGRRRKLQKELDFYGRHSRWQILHVGIKFVPGTPENPKKDEFWVQTAMRKSEKTVAKLLRQNKIRPVFGSPSNKPLDR